MKQFRYVSILLLLSLFSSRVLGHCESPLYDKIKRDVLSQNYPTLSTAEETTNNRFGSKVYLGSDSIFSKATELIEHAKKQILFQTWNFEANSEPAKQLAQALSNLRNKREQAGATNQVHVWMLINVTGLQNYEKKKQEFIDFVKKHQLNNQYVRIIIGIYRAKLLGANHAKSLIVDNHRALVTGANASNYFNLNKLFDAGFVAEGEAVHSMSKDFIQVWNNRFHAQSAPSQLDLVQAQSCTPVLFTRNDAIADPTKKIQTSSVNIAFLSSIQNAKKRVDIFTPSLNVSEFINKISDAILRGVHVRIILSKKYEAFKQDLPTRGGANIKRVKRLYEKLRRTFSKLEICQSLQIKWFSQNGRNAVLTAKGPNSHVKYMQVDNQVAYIGSSNMDRQSWVNSREIGLFVDSQFLAKQWNQQLFLPAFKQAILVDECRDSM